MNKTLQKSSKFKKDFKQYKNDKKVCNELKTVIYYLDNDIPLPLKYCDHKLNGEYGNSRDCHLFPNIVLIYSCNGNTISLTRIGTHNKLGLTETLHKLHIRESD